MTPEIVAGDLDFLGSGSRVPMMLGCLLVVFLVGCLSGQEILIVVFVLALVMGASRLPQLGDALGRAVRNFKKGIKGENEIDVTPKKQVEAPEKPEDSGTS